ncbi:MAG: PHP domain-containing protein [Bacteroidales bacterium]|nr:PHP domain-containing protein [Bacteroidales bacterium]
MKREIKFSHLHVHSIYSEIDAICKPDELIRRSVELGMNAIAITDHGSMKAVMEMAKFVQKQKERGRIDSSFKFIPGTEAYIVEDLETAHDNSSVRHLVLLAKSEVGYRNLCRLSSLGYLEGFNRIPRIDHKMLEKYHEGIIACSACLGGEIPRLIIDGREDEAEKVLLWYMDLFGYDFYIEMQRHVSDTETYRTQQYVNEVLLRLANRHGANIIATNDVHFINAEDADAQDEFMNFSRKYKKLRTGIHYTGQEYLKSPEEMAELFADIPEAIYNVREIVDKVDVDILSLHDSCLEASVPNDFENSKEYLKFLVMQGAMAHYGKTIPAEVLNRIEEEMKYLTENKNFADYMLLVYDIYKSIRIELGLQVRGRGFMNGSIVCYCLHLTDIDPIKYGLTNWLFFKDANHLPIAMEVGIDDIGKISRYLTEKYGSENFAGAVSFVPWKENSLKNNCINNIAILEGTVRQDWVSYSSVLICANDMMSKLPLCRVGDNIVSQYKMYEIDCSEVCAIGIYNEDKLSRIDEILKRIKDKNGYDIRAEDIPMNDKSTFDLICSGDYLLPVESIMPYLKQLNRVSFCELVDLWAVAGRPQWKQIVAEYISEKNNPQKMYPSPAVEAIFKPTGGMPLYREQLYQLLIDVLGYNSNMALKLYNDILDSIDDLLFQKEEFVRRGFERGFSVDSIDEFWEMLKRWENLAMKSVYVGDCMLEYRLAYLKANYFEFFDEN